ncbi:MAG TPA: MgtC/SapB family protein [Terriglobales bacterium]|nr:MgtC/SapB family protein [Terriglobales bacterium]
MDWKLEMLMAARAVAAAFLGALIGWDRERHGHEAGVRTYAAVALGACVFGLVSSHVKGTYDSTRIAAQVVTGIGFLGAGVIIRDKGRTFGLTTAATLWSSAAVGLAMAFGMYVLATLTAVLLAALLWAHHLRRPKTAKESGGASS